MRLSVQLAQSSNAHGKRPREVEDSLGGGSTKFKLRRCRPVDSARDSPSFCGRSADVEKVAEAEKEHRPTADSGMGKVEPIEIVNDYGDCVLATSPKSRGFFDWAEEEADHRSRDRTIDGDCVLAKSPKSCGFFDWEEGEADHSSRDQTRDDEPEDFSNNARDDAAGEEDADDNQTRDDEPEDFSDSARDNAAGEEDADDNQTRDDEQKDFCDNVGGDRAAGEEEDARSKVQEVLNMFNELYKKLAMEYEQVRNGGPVTKRCASQAAMILRKEKKCLNSKHTFGHVPGVEIGDKYKFRAEMAVIGLHTEFNYGISSTIIGDREYAVSIVDAGRYDNRTKSSGILVYSGHGGNRDVKAKFSRDQALEGGNLALKNSIDARYPVRVIRKIEVKRHTYEYFYDGLYDAVKYWPETSSSGRVVYMFELVRIEGQPKIDFCAIAKRRPYSRKAKL